MATSAARTACLRHSCSRGSFRITPKSICCLRYPVRGRAVNFLAFVFAAEPRLG